MNKVLNCTCSYARLRLMERPTDQPPTLVPGTTFCCAPSHQTHPCTSGPQPVVDAASLCALPLLSATTCTRSASLSETNPLHSRLSSLTAPPFSLARVLPPPPPTGRPDCHPLCFFAFRVYTPPGTPLCCKVCASITPLSGSRCPNYKISPLYSNSASRT